MSAIDDFLNDKPAASTSAIDGFLADAPPKPAGFMRRAADTGLSLAKGVIGVPEAAVGVADLVTGGQAGKLVESAGVRFKDAKGVLNEMYSPEQKAANEDVNQTKGFFPTIGAMARNPSTILNQAVESAPSMLVGGVASRGLLAAAPRIGAVAAGAIGEGITAAGQNAEQVRQEDPNGTLTGEQSAILAGSGLLTGGISLASGKLANKLGIGDVQTMLAAGKAGAVGEQAIAAGAQKGLARKVAEGVGVEGVLQELPQSYQEQVGQNLAQGKPWDEGAAEAGAQGMMAGGLMGGIAGPLGGSEAKASPAPTQEPAAPAETSDGPAPSTPPGLGFNPNAGTHTVFPDGSVILNSDSAAGEQAVFDKRFAPQPVDPVRAAVQQAADAGGALSAAAGLAMDSGAYMPPAGQAAPTAPEPNPVVLQNRDRTSAASIAQMQDIAARPNYLRVGPSRDMTSGAPVVFGELPATAIMGKPETVVDGKDKQVSTQYAVVDAGDLLASHNADGTTVGEYANGAPGKLRSVAGNGRTAGLQAAYQMGTAGNYRQALMADAASFGADPQAIAAMQRPVLVRVMQSADVTDDMGDRTNITATQKLSPLEQAANDARRLDVRTLAFDEAGAPTPDTIKGFVSAQPVAERGDMLNADGSPTRQAVDRLMAATFKQAYESDELVQLYAQATDPDARAVMAAAAEASGVMANLKDAGEFDLRAAVADAAKLAINAARQGLKLSDVMKNADLDMNPDAFPVAAFLANNIRSPRKMAEGLRRWGQLALEQARIADENTRQGGMFGPAPTLTRQEILARLGSNDNPTEQGIAPVKVAGREAAPPIQPVLAEAPPAPQPTAAPASQAKQDAPGVPAALAPAPAAAPRSDAAELAQAGQQWDAAAPAERQAIADRADLKGVLKNNVKTRAWASLNVQVQRTLADAMTAQALDSQANTAQAQYVRAQAAIESGATKGAPEITAAAPGVEPDANTVPESVPAEDAAKASPAPARRGVAAQAAQAQQARAEYFTPGNIVKSYGGHDRVVSYQPGADGKPWSVTVEAVVEQGGQWAADPKNRRIRTHSTPPEARVLKAGPVMRAPIVESPVLTGPTQQDVLAQQARAEAASKTEAKAAANAANKAKADAERGEFTLTGSERAADVGAAGGQETMFSRPQTRLASTFIQAPDGSIDFGEITPEMGKAMRRQAGKIRLQEGVQNQDGTGYGLAHIEANHGNQIRNAGYASVEKFVQKVASTFNQVWQPGKSTQLLVAARDGKQELMYVRLEPSESGDFYRINSAFPVSRDYFEKQAKKGAKILWDGSEPASTVAGQQPAYATETPDQSSSQGSPIARGQSNPSVEVGSQTGKPDIRFSRQDNASTGTAKTVRSALAKRFGLAVLQLEKRGILKIWDSAEQFNAAAQPSRQIQGAAQGMWDGRVAHLFADGIEPGREVAVLLHEVGEHASMKKMLGPEAYQLLVARAHTLAFADDATALTAIARIPDDTPPKHLDSELLAYMIETVAAQDAGATPSARKWLADVVAAIRAWWSQTGFAAALAKAGIRMELTPKDMAALAVRAVKWQAGQGMQPATTEQRGTARDTSAFSLGQAKQIDTPAFKAWYGDWQNAAHEPTRPNSGIPQQPAGDGGSVDGGRRNDVNAVQRRGDVGADRGRSIAVGQVHFTGASGPVGKDGKPVVFFHGTREDFSVFQLGHAGRLDKGWLGRGAYTTSSTDLAELYAEQKRGSGERNIMPLYVAVRNPYVTTNALKIKLKNASQATIDKFTQSLKDLGHDGVVMVVAEGHVELMAFEPAQVKSAIGNNGEFDGTNPDIRYSRPAAIGDALKAVTVTDLKAKAGNRLADYRNLGLQFLGGRQINDLYGKDIPQLPEYMRMVQQMSADANEVGANADAVATAWGKLKDERQLAELMHDATLAQIDPAKEYVTGDNKLQWGALNAKFKALSPEARKVYTEARDGYEEHYAKVREAIRDKIERSDLAKPAKAAMLERMDGEFFDKVKGVYFPLARFGKYVVLTRNAAGEVVNVSRAETMNEAEALRGAMRKAYPGHSVGKVLKDKEFNAARDSVGRGFLKDLFGVLDKQGVGEELQDAVNQLYLASMPDLSWAKHGIHRKGTPGFSQDARRAYAQNMFHGARYLAKLRYADQLQGQLDEMEKFIDIHKEDEGFDQPKVRSVLDEVVKRHDSLMNPKSNPLSTALTSFGFVFHLGLSPASAMVNLSQTALVAYPIMGAKWGFDKAAAALAVAGKQAAANKNDISSALNPDERRAYEVAVNAGTIDVTNAHDLAGISQGEDSGVMWKIRPVMKWASFLFHHAERFNRQVTFVASYRLARAAGTAHEAAIEQATKATYDGHFDYASSNRARVLQGNVGKVIFLFKQFGQNMIYTIARQAQLAIKAETPKGRKEARKALSGLLVMHAAGAGVLGLPLVTTLLAAASMIGGSDDEPWDAEVALRNMLADTFGQKPAEVMARGLSRLTPWDISSRVGLDKLILPDVQEGLEGQRLAESAMTAALGPVAGIGVNALKGMQEIAHGEYARGLESMMPAALRGPMKALRYGQEGAKDKTGIVIKDEVGAGGLLGQTLGFSPSEVRSATEGRSAIYAADSRLGKRRAALLEQFAHAYMKHDDEAMAQVRTEIAGFNEKNPQRRINNVQLMHSVHGRQKRINQAKDGIYLPKKRQDMREVGRFAVEG